MKKSILIFLVSLLFAGTVLGQSLSNTLAGREEFNKAHNYFVLEQFKEAEELFKKAVEKGHILSMTYLGSLYQNAQNKPGITRNYSEALKWYKMAADKGEYMAMRSLSSMYAYGYGVPVNVEESKRWTEKATAAKAAEDAALAQAKAAAAPKTSTAQSSTTTAKNSGNLVEQANKAYNSKNFAEALKLFQTAAAAGDAQAMFSLGIMNAKGEAVPASKSEAFKWYKKSAEAGYPKGMFNTGVMLFSGDGVIKDLSSAFSWTRKAAEAGYTDAMYNLALIYENGYGTTASKDLAKSWYKKAADLGHANAMIAYGKLNTPLPTESEMNMLALDAKKMEKAPASELKPIINTLVPYLAKNGKYGLADRSGRLVVSPKYDFSPRVADDGFIYVVENKKYGLLDNKGTVLITPKYDAFSDFQEGLARVRINDYSSGSLVFREAFIDKTDKVIIQGSPEMKLEGDFSEGRAVIIGKQGIGFIDRNGKAVIPPKYQANTFSNYGNIFTQGAARVVRKDGTYTLINTAGKELTSKPYEDISGNTAFIQFNEWEGIFIYKLNKLSGFMDKSGKEMTRAIYDSANPFRDGMGRFSKSRKYGFIDRSGKEIIAPAYDNARDFVSGMAAVQVAGKWGYIDKTGKLLIPAQFESASDFSEEVAAVRINNRYLYINKKGQYVIDPDAVDYAGPFAEGLSPVRKNGLYGFIDKNGILKIQHKYFNIGFNSFKNGLMYIEASRNVWLTIDRNGKEFKE
jgi:TPR repeat protein